MHEGDCDSNNECKSHLFCGSNNCPSSLGTSISVDCCEPKGGKKLLITFQPYDLIYYFQLLTESCAMNYCQNGLQVKTQQYIYQPIHGNYELQQNDVNGRPYFKMGYYGFWWNGIDKWWIGYDISKGQSVGFAYYDKDVFCPHQLSELNWRLWDGINMYSAGNDLVIICKCHVIQECGLFLDLTVHSFKGNFLNIFQVTIVMPFS